MSKVKKKSKKNKTNVSQPLSQETKPRQTESQGTKRNLKVILLIVTGIIALLIVLYILFGLKQSTSAKKDQLKDYNVILITLDTLRCDYISAYHSGKANTPHIDAIANEGVLFDRCIAQTPLTLPSHTSILSSSYPLYHQIRDNGGFLVPQSLEMVSEILQQNKISTSAFIASYVLHSKWGINQGFDTYSDEFDLTKFKKVSLGIVQKRADEVLGNAKKWLTIHKQTQKNKQFFSWIHLYDPHTPYDPPSPWKEKYPRKPYRGEVEYMDDQLGQFFAFLKKQDIYDNTLIIVTADHGESLGEHGERTHGFFIYEPTVHVPLIIRAPFSFPIKKVENIVELIDIAPTILEALGLAIPDSYQGQSLLGLMFGDKERKKNNAYTETFYPRLHFGWSELKALYYDKHWKYIMAPKAEMYDLSKDKKEEHNLVLKKSYQSKQVKNRFQKFISQQSANARQPGEAKTLDKDDLQKLAALGYLTTIVNTSGKQNLPDPKGKVGIFNNLSNAKELMSKDRHREAIQLLEKVIAGDPHIVDGILQLGNAYNKINEPEKALVQYYKVLEQKPDYNAAMINVLNALIRLRRFNKGIEEANRFLKTFPNDHALLNELAALHILKEQYDLALEILNRSIKIEKINPRAFNKIGGIYIVKKEFQKAETFIKKAFDINPKLKKIHFHLAQVEEAKGDTLKAIELYKKELDYFPEDFRAAYNLAEELRKSGKYAEALQYYQSAMASNPYFNIPFFMTAKYYLDRKENLDKAAELCHKGIEIKPVDKYTAFGYFILSDIYSYRGNQAQSQTFLQKAQVIKSDLIRKNKW
jgi:arylsulfatase A-like enzyme/lipopolysaccharide biosynthesis regulator YciM